MRFVRLGAWAMALVVAYGVLKHPAIAEAPAAPAPGDLVVNDCVMCHEARLLEQQRLTGEQWTKTVDKMQKWGAPMVEGDLPLLTGHLAGSYGRDAGRFHPETLSASEAAALFAPQPDGPFAGGHPEHGAELYDYQCVDCHQKDGLGGPQGVALAGRLVLDRAADFAKVVRSGRGGMPDFSDTSDADMADLLAYLRSLP